jgi:hypothetical protein
MMMRDDSTIWEEFGISYQRQFCDSGKSIASAHCADVVQQILNASSELFWIAGPHAVVELD